LSVSASDEQIKKLNQKILELEDSILDLQVSRMSERFKFSGEFGMHYDNFQTDGWDKAPKNRSVQTSNIRFKLNADVDVSNRIKFYSSLFSMFYMNKSAVEVGPVLESGRLFDGTSFLRLSRAYFDYQIIKNKLSFSAGRLPTTNGPPEHLKDGDARLGTYNSLSYSLPFDGFALTYKWNSPSKKHYFSLRSIYNPGNIIPTTEIMGGKEKGKANEVRGQIMKPSDFIFGTFEYQTKALKLADKITFLFNYSNFSISGPAETESRGVLDKNLAGDRNIYRISHALDKAYSAENFVAYLELDEVLNSNFSFYLTYKYTDAKNRGNTIATIIEDNEGGALGGQGTQYSLGGFLSATDISAGQQLHGIRYKFSSKYITGFEYINTNIGTTPASFYNRRNNQLYVWMGQGFHNYFTMTFLKHSSSLRIGYINFLRDHYFNNVNYSPIDQRVHNAYLSYILRL